jgi:hypothetical protein
MRIEGSDEKTRLGSSLGLGLGLAGKAIANDSAMVVVVSFRSAGRSGHLAFSFLGTGRRIGGNVRKRVVTPGAN